VKGLDIRRDSLEFAGTVLAETDEGRERWGDDLSIELWHGSLDVFFEAFCGTEVIVASEVIEHLPPVCTLYLWRVILLIIVYRIRWRCFPR